MRDYAPDFVANSLALAKSLVVRTTNCRVFDITVSYTGAAKVFVQLHNTAAVPAAGAVPLAFTEIDPAISTYATGNGSLTWPKGRPLSVGCTVVLSSTAATYTAVAGNEAIIDVSFNNQ